MEVENKQFLPLKFAQNIIFPPSVRRSLLIGRQSITFVINAREVFGIQYALVSAFDRLIQISSEYLIYREGRYNGPFSLSLFSN